MADDNDDGYGLPPADEFDLYGTDSGEVKIENEVGTGTGAPKTETKKKVGTQTGIKTPKGKPKQKIGTGTEVKDKKKRNQTVSIDQEAPYIGVKGPHAQDWMKTIDEKRRGFQVPDKASLISELDNIRDSASADEKEETDRLLRAIVDAPGVAPRLILGSKIKDRNKFWDINKKVGAFRMQTPEMMLGDDKDFDNYRFDRVPRRTRVEVEENEGDVAPLKPGEKGRKKKAAKRHVNNVENYYTKFGATDPYHNVKKWREMGIEDRGEIYTLTDNALDNLRRGSNKNTGTGFNSLDSWNTEGKRRQMIDAYESLSKIRNRKKKEAAQWLMSDVFRTGLSVAIIKGMRNQGWVLQKQIEDTYDGSTTDFIKEILSTDSFGNPVDIMSQLEDGVLGAEYNQDFGKNLLNNFKKRAVMKLNEIKGAKVPTDEEIEKEDKRVETVDRKHNEYVARVSRAANIRELTMQGYNEVLKGHQGGYTPRRHQMAIMESIIKDAANRFLDQNGKKLKPEVFLERASDLEDETGQKYEVTVKDVLKDAEEYIGKFMEILNDGENKQHFRNVSNQLKTKYGKDWNKINKRLIDVLGLDPKKNPQVLPPMSVIFACPELWVSEKFQSEKDTKKESKDIVADVISEELANGDITQEELEEIKERVAKPRRKNTMKDVQEMNKVGDGGREDKTIQVPEAFKNVKSWDDFAMVFQKDRDFLKKYRPVYLVFQKVWLNGKNVYTPSRTEFENWKEYPKPKGMENFTIDDFIRYLYSIKG